MLMCLLLKLLLKFSFNTEHENKEILKRTFQRKTFKAQNFISAVIDKY